MLKNNQLFRAFLILSLVLGLYACGGGGEDSNNDQASITEIEIRSNYAQLETRGAAQLQVIAKYDDNSEKDITPEVKWGVIDERLATLDNNGSLTTNKVIDELEISAEYNGIDARKTFQITKKANAVINQIIFPDTTTIENLSPNQELSVSAVYDDGSIAENVTAVINAVDTPSESTEKTLTLSVAESKVEVSVPPGIDSSQDITLAAVTIEEPVANVNLQSISITTQSNKLAAGETTTIALQASYSDASSSVVTNDVIWSVTGPLLLNADNTIVTAKENFTATTASITADYQGLSTSQEITLTAPNGENVSTEIIAVTSITISADKTVLLTKETVSISVLADKSDGSQEDVTSQVQWVSSDEQKVTVDASTGSMIAGDLTGSASITANYLLAGVDTGINDSIVVTVNSPDQPATVVSLVINQEPLILNPGKNATLSATATMSDDSAKSNPAGLTWSSSNPAIASISNAGVIAALSAGATEITATLDGKSASMTLNVIEPPDTTITGLEFNPKSVSMATNRDFTNLLVYDENFRNVSNKVQWSSSDSNIVSVSQGGYLRSHSQVGTATITASMPDTSISASVLVTVTPNEGAIVDSVYIKNPPSTLFYNQSVSLALYATLSDKSNILLNKEVIWSSDDEQVASIDTLGLLTTQNLTGQAIIEANYADPATGDNHSAWITLKVNETDSFDNIKLQLDDFPQAIHIQDSSTIAPQISAMQNPVGITDDVKFITTQPGIFVSYANQVNSERLVLVLPSTNLSTYDKTTAHAFYVPDDNANMLYQLDDSANTSVEITLDSYGAIGEKASGIFETVLCLNDSIKLNTCHLAVNRIQLKGRFFATVENDLSFQSKNNLDNPTLLHVANMDQYHQIADLPNYHYEPTTSGVTYNFRTNNNDVMVEIIDANDKSKVLAKSELKTEGTGQIVTYEAVEKTTYLKLSYIGAAAGATYTLRNSTHALAAQGTVETPELIGVGKIPLIGFGTVDTTKSYYELDVTPGHSYFINLTNITLGADISLSVADTNSAASFQVCPLLECEVLSNSGKIFFQVTGDPNTGASYDIEVEYAPERFPEVTLPIVNRMGQVSYKDSVPSAVGSDSDFKSGTSSYWIVGDQLTPNTHYLISVRGLTAFTMLWINDPNNNLVDECSSGGNGGPAGQLTNVNLNEIYCMVKTGFNTNTGFAINILGERSTSGTTYVLNVDTIDAARVFYVSTFANEATSCNEFGLNCAPLIGMQLYRPGETTPFSFTLFNNDNFAKKALVLDPGETVYIRLIDPRHYANFYSIEIGQTGFRTNASLFRTIGDPDEFEAGAGDNTAATATPLLLNEASHHSFTSNTGQFSDEDWFVFTAP